jgi:hypothetical protein
MLFQFGVMNTPADLVNTKIMSLYFEGGVVKTCIQYLIILDKIYSRGIFAQDSPFIVGECLLRISHS